MRASISWMSFLSGNLPICLILIVTLIHKYIITNNFLCIPTMIAIFYFGVCFLSAKFLLTHISEEFNRLKERNGGVYGKMCKIRIHNIFSSGAMTYYILPFISFAAGDDILKNEIILFILIFIFGILYVRERMIIYTPILGLCGYIVLSANLKDIQNNEIGETLILMKRTRNLMLGPIQEYDIVYKRIGGVSALVLIEPNVEL